MNKIGISKHFKLAIIIVFAITGAAYYFLNFYGKSVVRDAEELSDQWFNKMNVIGYTPRFQIHLHISELQKIESDMSNITPKNECQAKHLGTIKASMYIGLESIRNFVSTGDEALLEKSNKSIIDSIKSLKQCRYEILLYRPNHQAAK